MIDSPPNSSLKSGTPTSMDTLDTTDHKNARQPLQILEPVPLNKRPPPVTATSSPFNLMTTAKSMGPPTPPITPLQRRHKRCSTSAGSISLDKVAEGSTVDVARESQAPDMPGASGSRSDANDWERTRPRAYTKQYQRQAPDLHGKEEFGRGVWSLVYRAIEGSPTHPTTPLTPPTSPISGGPSVLSKRVLAVKAPSRRDAHRILDHEARILTYLHSFGKASDYLTPFHGYDQATHSIILSAIPLNLDTHVRAAAATARANFSTRTMFDPIVGTEEWSSLAIALVSGLSFLHSKHCIHGDIKPANILLQPSIGNNDNNSKEPYIPLYCDFSSSLITSDPAPPEISALTQDYSSPELLASLTNPSVPTLPTAAADVYALAVTLLFAAIGESPYAGAKMEMLKLSMAREGRPLQFAKAGDQAARVRKGGMVERCLTGAVMKDVAERWGVERWRGEVERVVGL
ncbi:MAG: hypothetical protein HETSPECPRED_002328 [Heterodermia speciosa]|uniref:mitogen-activated protein kinase kinase n=1 Tax=Heterodermia speciosa TaxID=116794 RepID=A0A8H3F0C7_9LECA|nr:MAG: hypothetical protein HETSPECPRED_002328 [Heterodermia speciosa]